MSCPHSNAPDASPLRCSQCLKATARKVTIDKDTTVRLDGVDQGKLAEWNKNRQAEETASAGPRSKQKQCGRCGGLGHNRATCHRPVEQDLQEDDYN